MTITTVSTTVLYCDVSFSTYDQIFFVFVPTNSQNVQNHATSHDAWQIQMKQYASQEVNEPVISWSEVIVDELGLMTGPARLLPTTPRRCTFDRRHEDLSGRMVRLISQ